MSRIDLATGMERRSCMWNEGEERFLIEYDLNSQAVHYDLLAVLPAGALAGLARVSLHAQAATEVRC